jgi:nucleotide-binding universal stress UspA family protein
MTPVLLTITTALGFGVVLLAGLYLRERRQAAPPLPASANRILFPFAGHALSRRALDAALRLALAERATLVPVFLARVPLQLPLDAPLPRQCTEGMPLLETIEQRAVARGVPVDARIERGRTLRHGLREAIAHERFDRLVVAAASLTSEGFRGDDIAWLLDHAPGEVVIIRPAGDDRLNGGNRRDARHGTARRAKPESQPIPVG